ncbi:MAG: nucleotide exchange factor GrpE [Bacillota bacterium]
MQERDTKVLDKEPEIINETEAPEETRQAGTEEAAADGTPGEDVQDQPADGEKENLMRMLAGEKAKAEDYFNRLARMQADFDNYRKRVAKEREDLIKYAGEQIITALLPVIDNLERALAAKDGDSGKLAEGVEMIGRQINDILAREGIEIIPTVGEQFNPEIHEAVMREECGDHPENTVIEEFRKGYTLKGKVIRPAMVKVAV